MLFVTFERIRDELSRAASRNSFAQVPLSLEAQGVLAKLGVVATDVPLGIDASHDDDLGLASQAAGLHDEPEVVSWLPPDTDLQVMAQRLEEQPTASAEQKREVAKALSVNFATPSIRALYANRLWRMAEFFDGTGRLAQGQTARAEARQLLHSTAQLT